MNEGERIEHPDQAALEALGREIDEETEAIADLRRRTHTLEIEIAAWWREPPRPPPARGSTANPLEMALGLALGGASSVILYKLLSLFSGGRG